jgi:hypothetical protein
MKLFIYTTGLVFFILIITLTPSCTGEKADYPLPDLATCEIFDTLTYTNNVRPILKTNCALKGCHGKGSAQDGVNLDTYAGVVEAENNNTFRCSINHGNGCINMPKNEDKLPASEIRIIECWVAKGMLE